MSLTRPTLIKLGRGPFQHLPRRCWAFLGLCSYYRRFIRNFAHTAEPLHRLTHKGVPFTWSAQASESFSILKEALTSPPIMAFPNLSITFLLYMDASLHSVGSVLSQHVDGKEHVIAYASHVLTTSERKWSTFDRELFAIVWSVRHFRHYLACYPFTIVTDHKPLIGLKKLPLDHDPTGRRARWAVELDLYDWCVRHREGAKHLNADAMSRRPQVEVVQHDKGDKRKPAHCSNRRQTRRTHLKRMFIPSVTPVPKYVTANLIRIQSDWKVADQQRSDSYLATVHSWVEIGNNPPPRWKLRNASPYVRKL